MNTAPKPQEYWTFLRRALHAPTTMGAVLPTMRYVADAVATVVPSAELTAAELGETGTGGTRPADPTGTSPARPPAGADQAHRATGGAPVVVELGPGTGALSDAIGRRISPRARHVAVELDPELASYLRETKPWLEVVRGDAAQLPELLEERGIRSVDALITSIPWTLLEHPRQRDLLNACAQVLAPSAPLTTVTYVTTLWRQSTRDFLGLLEETFDEVLPRSTIFRNVPPARIYICRRPKPRRVSSSSRNSDANS